MQMRQGFTAALAIGLTAALAGTGLAKTRAGSIRLGPTIRVQTPGSNPTTCPVEGEPAIAVTVAGTWVATTTTENGQAKQDVDEVLTLTSACSGVLNRTTTSYERGFAGWKKGGVEQRSLTFRCDRLGQVTGQVTGVIVPQGDNLVWNGRSFARKH